MSERLRRARATENVDALRAMGSAGGKASAEVKAKDRAAKLEKENLLKDIDADRKNAEAIALARQRRDDLLDDAETDARERGAAEEPEQ